MTYREGKDIQKAMEHRRQELMSTSRYFASISLLALLGCGTAFATGAPGVGIFAAVVATIGVSVSLFYSREARKIPLEGSDQASRSRRGILVRVFRWDALTDSDRAWLHTVGAVIAIPAAAGVWLFTDQGWLAGIGFLYAAVELALAAFYLSRLRARRAGR